MSIARCASLGTPRRLRYAIGAVVLLLGGVMWLLPVLSPRLPLSSPFTYSGVSHRVSSPVDTPIRSSRRPANGPLSVPASGPASRAPSQPQRPLPSQSQRPPLVLHQPQRPLLVLHQPQRPLLVLHWTERPSDTDGVQLSVHNASFSGCPVSNCVGTADRSRILEADAVLFHGRLLKLKDLPKRRLPRQRFVFVLRESPQSTHLPLKKLDGFFNLTMTYSRDADVLFPYGMIAEGKQAGTLPFFHRRRRPVAWMVSHCRTYSLRERYITQLRRHLPVDSFGACGDRLCPGSRLDCYRRLAETHLFYLSFENSLCEDYITEKFWLALLVGMVPVVRGPPPEAYRRVAPPHSFIHVEDFAGPKALASYLLSLTQNRTEYGRYHTWRRSHHVLTLPRGLCELCRWLGSGGQDPAVSLGRSGQDPAVPLGRSGQDPAVPLGRSGRDSAVSLSKVWSTETHCRKPSDVDGDG